MSPDPLATVTAVGNPRRTRHEHVWLRVEVTCPYRCRRGRHTHVLPFPTEGLTAADLARYAVVLAKCHRGPYGGLTDPRDLIGRALAELRHPSNTSTRTTALSPKPVGGQRP